VRLLLGCWCLGCACLLQHSAWSIRHMVSVCCHQLQRCNNYPQRVSESNAACSVLGQGTHRECRYAPLPGSHHCCLEGCHTPLMAHKGRQALTGRPPGIAIHYQLCRAASSTITQQ
jgi:hypothetical protein